MTKRIPLDALTSDEYDALCDTLDELRAELDALRSQPAPGAPTGPLYRWQDERRRRCAVERELARTRADLARLRNTRRTP